MKRPIAYAASTPLALAALLGGCGDGDTAPAPDGATPPPADARASDAGASASDADPRPRPDSSTASGAFIEIGTGARNYQPLAGGDEIPIIAGPQGGFHVWGGFRGDGFDDSDVRIVFELSLGGETYARADYTEFSLPPGAGGGYDYAAVAVVYDQNSDVQTTSGETMTLRLSVESSDGQVLTDTIDVVPVCCE